MTNFQITYQTGIPDKFKSAATDLYDEAFGNKIAVAIKEKKQRKKLLFNSLIPDYGIAAISNSQLLGIAGFQTPDGSLTGGIGYRDLLSQLGFLKGNRAALLFALYQRKSQPGELLMDGISVQTKVQGRGIGTGLLNHLKKYAIQHNYHTIRLDVIDTNPDAKRLYERMGFEAVDTIRFPPLESTVGFSAVTTMNLNLDNA